MKILINIGLPKTSSTNLQNNFYPKISNIEYLGKSNDKSKNKLWVKLNEYIEFRNEKFFDDEKNKEQFKEDFKIFCQKSKKNILISNENWSVPYQKNSISGKDEIVSQWKKLHRLNKFILSLNIDFKYFLIFRELKDAIPSLYSTLQHRIVNLFGYDYADFNILLKSVLNEDKNFEGTRLFFEVYNLNKIKEFFPKDSLKVLYYSDLVNNPETFANSLFKVLEIQPENNLINAVSKKRRVTKKINQNYLVKGKSFFTSTFKFFLPKKHIAVWEFNSQENKISTGLLFKYNFLRILEFDKKLFDQVIKKLNLIRNYDN